MELEKAVERVFRLTPGRAKALTRLGIATIRDLLFYLPSRYEEFVGEKTISELRAGERATIQCEVVKIKAQKTWKTRVNIAEAIVKDDTGLLRVIWFNQPYIAKMLPENTKVRLSGRIGKNKNGIYLANPTFEVSPERKTPLPHQESGVGKLLAVYPETYGISSRWIRAHVRKILENISNISDSIPEDVLKKYHLPKISLALRAAHFPKTLGEAEAARKRFSFEEIFIIQLARQRDRKKFGEALSFKIETPQEAVDDLIKSLPFRLTRAQDRVLSEILADFKKPHPMARLIEGDVGSGKTIVAAGASLAVAKAGMQVAMLAPTEILARQHFDEFSRCLGPFRVPLGLLTSSEARKFPSKVPRFIEPGSRPQSGLGINPKLSTSISKNQLLRWVASGEIKVLIGTHALIQDRVRFKKLGFVVVDEQHRFGVRQRASLMRSKTTNVSESTKHEKIVEKELSYKLGGLFFKIQGRLGRFCRERQYGDALEKELQEMGLSFKREYPITIAGRKSNFADFNIEDKILVDLKTKPFIEKSDYYQMKRYLEISGLEIGLLVNFRDTYLKPKRVLNPKSFVDSDAFVASNRLPHFLSMSATPIPRTLALTLYGDLDLSLIDEMPPGRKPVKTKIVLPSERQEVYEFIRNEIKDGAQAFIVCPKIEDAKKIRPWPAAASFWTAEWNDVKSVKAEFKRLSEEIFPDFKVDIIHGKLTPKEKEKVMRSFRDGKLDILVATSVVEVGVDIPNASIMVIEGGERFGLATLHQFRGRVGRKGQEAYCFVFTTSQDQTGIRRLRALEGTKTGFELAEYDLQFRGPGELAGRRQWGISDIGMEALKNIKMVEAARAEAARIIGEDPELTKYPLLKERLDDIQAVHFE